MILQSLISYAERETLGDPDFEPGEIDWVIPLTADGTLCGAPIDLRESPRRRLVPAIEQKLLTDANRPRARFLCDSLERALGWPDPKKPERAKRTAGSLEFFKDLLRQCSAACPSSNSKLHAAINFLDISEKTEALHAQLTAAKAKSNEIATFTVDGVWLLDLEGTTQFWRAWRKQHCSVPAAGKRTCIATGEFTETVDTAGTIRGVPGGNSQGTVFLSFHRDSFCSFGLEQAQNAALSAAAEVKVRSAMNRLIEKSREQKLVFNDTVYLHWTRKPVQDDPIDLLASPDENAVAQLLGSFRSGRQPIDVDENEYYAIGLSGNGARIVVRDWLESTVSEVRQHVAEWFQDIGIVSPDGIGVRREFSLGQMLWALANPRLERPFDALPHGAAEDLMQAALTGGVVPQNILAAALRREIVDRVSGGDDARQRKPSFLTLRFALIKLCLLRSPNRKDHQRMSISEKLDPRSKDVPYLCGQLFAVLGRLQLLALGKVGASIAERTYGGVATRPATTLGPLFTKVPAYLKKANDRFPGAGTNKQKEIEALCQRIEEGGGLPKTLALEEQARFALGYYCQFAEYRAGREEAELEHEAELTETPI